MKKVTENSKWTRTSLGDIITAKVQKVQSVGGDTYVTYLRKGISGESIQTMREETFLEVFQKKATFFEVGKVYKFDWTDTKYYIKEVHDISKAASHRRKVAFAISINRYDLRDAELLDKDDFASMKEVTS